MFHQLKKLKLCAIFVGFLSGMTSADASLTSHPKRTEGISFGIGAGVKLLSLKNVVTRTGPGAANPIRSGNSFSNASSPVIGIYARKYMPDLTMFPTFVGLEFNYLTDMRKTNIYARLNFPAGVQTPFSNGNDTGYRYQERWDARFMLGAQVACFSQVDFWAQLGLQLTNFEYQGITAEPGNPTQNFSMHNNYALAPAGGLEVRFSQPNILPNFEYIVTDFIVGWTAGYRSAFAHAVTARSSNSFNFAMSSNWSHTFGLKVMLRF